MRRGGALLAALLLAAPAAGAREFGESEQVQPITAEELLALLIERESPDAGPALVDTRGPMLFARDRIPGAVNVHAGRVFQGDDALDAFRERGVILYSGNGASARRVAQKLLERGHRRVFLLEGTIRNWRFSGYPLESGEPTDAETGAAPAEPGG